MENSLPSPEQHQEQGENPPQSPQCDDDFSSFIKTNTNDLIYMITTQFGLLEALESNQVLTTQQVSLIHEKDTYIREVRQLLEEITREKISDEKREAFLDALDQTQQKHASNYIRGKKVRATEYGDDWPLMCLEEFSRLSTNRSKLVDFIDPRNGLLDEMLAVGCINNRQKHSIEEGGTDETRINRIFNIVFWGGLATYNAFVHSLQLTKQHQVVALLEPSIVRDKGLHPLNDEQLSRINKNQPTLVSILNVEDGLAAELLATDCITSRQKKYIESANTESERNTRLIDIVRRGSRRDFHTFIECLNKTGQHHVSHIMIEDGAVAHLVATISTADNRELQERQIVHQLTTLLRGLRMPDDQIAERVDEARQLLNQLNKNEVTLLAAQKGSIGLFFFITSLGGLQYLHEIYSNEQLKSMMEDIFIILLKTKNAVIDLHIDNLRWDQSNYTDCLQQLYKITNLPILSHVYEMAEENQKLISICDDKRLLPIDQLPFELVEILLIRTTGHLFAAINRTTPARAAVYTMATMWAVSHLWWEALSYRKYIKRLLKRSFQRICHPFECSPQRVTSLHIEGVKNVMGVAVFNDELYVACDVSNTIQVFDSRPPFSRRDDIKVQGLEYATDIAVCSKSSQLYIVDYRQCAIWRVNLSSIAPADKFITIQWQPWSLSVNSSRLLITPDDGYSLHLYGDDGNELRHIQLPRYMRARHAVEKTHNTYLVSHVNRFYDDVTHRDSVTEVDVNGRVIRTFNDDIYSIHFNYPLYLMLANDHVLVADLFNERIILLKSDLQLKRVLINELSGKQPVKMCLTSSRLLVVTYFNSTDIDVFKV